LHKKNIIFFIIIVIIIVTGSIVISGNFSSKSGRPPQITISEEEWDFGLVKPEEKPTHVFTIKNKGNEDLIVERVWASCGCVQTSISTNRILPGKSAELKATFNTVGYEGKLEKLIYIKSNDPEEMEKKIKVKVDIEHQFKPKINTPATEWNMGLVSQGDVLNLSFPIENQGDAELIIDKIETYKHIQYNTSLPLKILPKGKFELILTYNSDEHKLGDVREAVRIYCNDPITESFFIRISGYIREKETPEVSISPIGIILDLAADSEEGAIGKFVLKNSGDETVKIISIKSSADYIAPLRSELSLKSRKEQDLQVVLLKDKAREEIDENKTEEYLYLTIAIPIKISK
jgi:glycine cleavage system regulatory protein